MANNKRNGTILLGIGIVILLLSLFADPLHIGQAPKFGIRQLTAAIMGAAFVGLGLLIRRQK
jgi:hypothetical protein